MKKTIYLATAMLLAGSVFGTAATVFAEEAEAPKVYVSISDENGKLAAVQEEISVTDVDSDGALTINDALYLAHEKTYDGGAAAGYASEVGSYGLMVTKLWGAENGGSYGYYVNNVAANGLGDAIKDGDYINAFVYTDLAGWSDSYSWFDKNSADASQGDEVTLTLNHIGFDENWAPQTLPVANATILINGETSEYKTDADGKVTIQLSTAGKNVISATSSDLTLVPPVYVANVKAEEASEPTSQPATESAATTTAPAAETTTPAATTVPTATPAATTTAKQTADAGYAIPAAVFGAAAAAMAVTFVVRRRNEE